MKLECTNCYNETETLSLTLGLCPECLSAYDKIKGYFEDKHTKSLQVLREEKLELRQKVRGLEQELNDLNSERYFVDGERITREHLDQKEKAPEDEVLEARDDAYKEIGRLRRFIDRVAKFHFPVGYKWDDIPPLAELVLNGEELDF